MIYIYRRILYSVCILFIILGKYIIIKKPLTTTFVGSFINENSKKNCCAGFFRCIDMNYLTFDLNSIPLTNVTAVVDNRQHII